MVNLQKSGDSAVKFVFTDSDHYLYGNGVVDVPVNSLLLVIDESDMVTFKKLSGDPFLSFRADNSNLGTKAAIEQFYKDNMVGSTGGGSESGITSGEVQTMIDESISGKADTSALTAVANDVSTLSGQVATKVAITDFNAYSAATDARLAEDEEVTAAALNNLDENKQDALEYYSEDTSGNTATIHIEDTENGTQSKVIVDGASVDMNAQSNYEEEGSAIETHTDIWGHSDGIAMTYEKNIDDAEAAHCYFNVNEGLMSMEVMANEETTNVDVYSTGVTINGDNVATEPYVDAATSGKVDTSAITSAITSASTNDEVAGAKAVYDAIQAGGGGVTVDQSLDTGSTNPVTNAAITNGFNNYTLRRNSDNGEVRYFYVSSPSQPYGGSGQKFSNFSINGRCPLTQTNGTNDYIDKFSLVETSAITTSITSSSTNSEVAGAKAVYDAIQAGGGGGATYSAGTNISIANDTINCTLPIEQTFITSKQDERYKCLWIKPTDVKVWINDSAPSTTYLNNLRPAFSFGPNYIKGIGHPAAFGQMNRLNGFDNFATGDYNNTNNNYEFATGAYNNSVNDSTASGQTLFSVGNGTSSARHNAFEIRQNGDIYVNDGTNDVRLQDTILALGGLKFVKLTQAEYSAMEQAGTLDANTLYIVTNVVS